MFDNVGVYCSFSFHAASPRSSFCAPLDCALAPEPAVCAESLLCAVRALLPNREWHSPCESGEGAACVHWVGGCASSNALKKEQEEQKGSFLIHFSLLWRNIFLTSP